MKKRINKITSILLVILLAVTAVSLAACGSDSEGPADGGAVTVISDGDDNVDTAEEGLVDNDEEGLVDIQEYDGVIYKLYSDDTLIVSGDGYADWYDYGVIVTDEGDIPVNEKFWKNQIKKVIAEEGIMGMNFSECENLTEVVIPGSVQYISEGSFSDCPNLTKVSVGEGVTTIYTGAFSRSASLAEIELPDSLINVGSDAFDGTALFDNPVDGVVYAGNVAIGYTDIQGSPTFREGTRVIADDAFSGLNSITSVTIPDGVVSIGQYAFSGCSNLSEVSIPDGVVSIGEFAFASCSNLSKINIPDSVYCIGQEAFENTKWYESQYEDAQRHQETIVYAGKVAYCCYLYGSLDEDLVLKEGTVGIADYAFKYVSYKAVKFPDSLKWIGVADITVCEQEELVIPDGVTHIGNSAIEGLSRIILPASVTSIADNAFCYPPDDFTIIAPKGSYAETYALENNILFKER